MFDNSSKDTLLERLIEASTFGLDDLELNRQGRMSGLQRSHLALMTIFYFGVCALLFGLAFGTIWLFFKQSQSIPFLAILIWVILLTYAGFHWLHQALPLWEDVQSDKVLCVSGPLHQVYTRVSNGRASIHLVHFRIAKKFFDVAFFAPKFIPQDQNCHAYYTIKSEILIGIEPI
jgi:hypothetical protein